MITDFAKMATGLVVRGGLGLPLRAAVFAAMAWGAWMFAPFSWELVLDASRTGNGSILIVMLVLAGPVIGAVFGLMSGLDGRRVEKYSREYSREPWGLWDFLRRAPFACWCLVTDDGRDVPIWAILSWPAIAAADFVLAVATLVAIPSRWLGLATAAVGRQAWRVLNIRPLDTGKKWKGQA